MKNLIVKIINKILLYYNKLYNKMPENYKFKMNKKKNKNKKNKNNKNNKLLNNNKKTV